MHTQSVSIRDLVVAQGRFAPGHLGELTQLVPFEMVDEALTVTRTTQSRVRDLPSRVVVYLLLAACLFPDRGYPGVWRTLTAALHSIPTATPTAGALCQARRRVGTAPLRWLFDLLRGPALGTTVPGARWRGLLVCALDGTTLATPDSPSNRTVLPKQAGNHGGCGYPLVRVVALVCCGTRMIIDAVFGPDSTGEQAYARQLLGNLHHGIMLVADRNFGVTALLADINATGAQFLVRVRTGRTGPRLPVLRRLPDGSYLSRLGSTPVRVIDADIAITTSTRRHTGSYRLITSLLDSRDHPALDLVTLYHERWEIETAYLEIKSTILCGRVLRAHTPAGIDQEIHAMLVTYQLLRLAMAEATSARPGIDPDRASFTVALHAARDLVVQAANVIADTTIDLVGRLGRRILSDLMPDRRTRTSPRAVKRAISKHQARGTVDRTSHPATISIDILSPPDS